ncbi:ribonuclease P/MRP protein subunit POP1 [Entomortierella parvispora]|uniref:Ribonuclease P/MRP protein subunit POP1 n=1 Tax=Entomortierella parvispora TaxID=205924 RepID=A0A9P3HAN9_9FUNG|nr:ribonuclease P/MRP protein subunit POP1 [Entomortierella parvispora]
MDKGNSGNKRPSPASNLGKDKKRVKMQQARSIQTQSGGNSPSVQSSPAGSSSTGSFKATRTLDVVNFAEARAFEIKAMHSAMKSSQDSASQRAFQSLPRNLRRRAASHNIRRLPVRLRERAQREVENDPVKPGKKPDNRHKKRRTGTLAEEYLKRQGAKRWLETHIWHAKRMKMVEMWGYKLAEHSNEHGIKSAYKSSHHQCILQDSSYNGCLEIIGNKAAISEIFSHMLDPSMPSLASARYATGKRQYTTYLYGRDRFPQNLIAPATFLWRQQASVSSTMEIDELSTEGQLWIWIHPSAFDLAKEKIQEAVANSKFHEKIHVIDLENSLVMFDFTGPRSTALLQAVLQPCKPEVSEAYEDAHKAWKTVSGLRTSSSVPPGVALGLLVDDPRLTFPHKAAPRPASIPAGEIKSIQDLITNWPSTAATSSLWDTKERALLQENMTPESKLNERRAQNLVPGTKLLALETDSRVPILLVQREGKPHLGRAPGGGSSEYECGWTLILPRGWGMPFWKSFIFAGAKPGGTRERRSFHFETRQSCFPYDFPNTAAYVAYAEEYRKEAEAKYSRKPVAKRINYSKLGVQDPFAAAWDKCLQAGLVNYEVEAVATSDVDQTKLWVMQSPKLVTALQDAATTAGNLNDAGARMSIQTLNDVVASCLRGMQPTTLEPFPKVEEAVIRVGVDYLNRGTISMNGMIYLIPEEHYKVWATRVQLRGKRTLEGHPRREKKTKSWVDSDSEDEDKEEEDLDLDELELALPAPETLLGYVTTGQYCYSEGQAYGIGCVSATGLARLIQSETRQRLTTASTKGSSTPIKTPKLMVLVRSIRSKASRLAKLQILS